VGKRPCGRKIPSASHQRIADRRTVPNEQVLRFAGVSLEALRLAGASPAGQSPIIEQTLTPMEQITNYQNTRLLTTQELLDHFLPSPNGKAL
jgi:hypothetical protein